MDRGKNKRNVSREMRNKTKAGMIGGGGVINERQRGRQEQDGRERQFSNKPFGCSGAGPLTPCCWRSPAPQSADQSTFPVIGVPLRCKQQTQLSKPPSQTILCDVCRHLIFKSALMLQILNQRTSNGLLLVFFFFVVFLIWISGI